MSNCLVAQSGGPTVVINASLAGVIKGALEAKEIDTVFGAVNGIQGVLNNHVLNLTECFGGDADKLEALKNTPAMFLGSCRYKLPKPEADMGPYDTIFNYFKENDIKYFFYIGGNDSMDTVDKLSQYAVDHNIDVKVIGVPKTVDNDLYGTDHTPGFASAAKYVATTILEIAHDTYIYDLDSVTIIEIMGRNAGWLTAASALARTEYSTAPDLIYLPEVPFDVAKFIEDVKEVQKNKRQVIVAVSEGIRDAEGNYVAAAVAGTNDAFGHAKLSGVGKTLEHLLGDKLGCKVRSVELSVLQRAAAHIASQTDIDEACALGEKGVEFALAGETCKMMATRRLSDAPYKTDVIAVDIKTAANHEKQVPREWINEAGNDMTEDFMTYARPLIVGEPSIRYANGLPKYLNVAHLLKK